MSRGMLTTPGGPVVASEKTLAALLAIRRQHFLPRLFGKIVIVRSTFDALGDAINDAQAKADAPCTWLLVEEDRLDQAIPERITAMHPRDEASEATIRLALALGASNVLLDGPIKEKAKLCFIKAEGTVSILVTAYREGWLSAVQPMVKALSALGHGDVLPDQEQLSALWRALAELET